MKKINSLNFLRAFAVFIIVYDHIGGKRGGDWFIKKMVDNLFSTPLCIIDDFGALGVCIFFVISGFFSAYNRDFISAKKAMKKVMKIYITVIFSFLFFLCFEAVLWIFKPTFWSQFTIIDWLKSISLLGWFDGSKDIINGNTWFLMPLFSFYLILPILKRLYDKFKNISILIIEFILSVLIYFIYKLHFPLTMHLIYIFIPISGMLFGMLISKKLKIDEFAIFQLINYLIMVLAFRKIDYNHYADNQYLVSFIYAILLLIVFYFFESYFSSNKIIDFFCDISLSVYLLHNTFGSEIMTQLYYAEVPFTFSFIITLIAIFFISVLHYEIIEKKIINLILNSIFLRVDSKSNKA